MKLPEHDRQLLTAYVDGELGARQKRLVLKLLHRSGEARALLKQLQEHARALYELPRVRSHPALSDSVLQLIRARQLKPRPAAPPRRYLPVWANYAVAAAVLVVVCGASYLFFAHSLEQSTSPIVAGKDSPNRPKTTEPLPPVQPNDQNVAIVPPELLPTPRVDTPIVSVTPTPEPTPVAPKTVPDKPNDPTILTAPTSELVELKMADIAAPLIVKLQDADQPNTRTNLLIELGKANAFRLEFPCRNGTRAFERFQAACKTQDITLTIEQYAAERVKHPHLRTNYALYLEDVTPEELAKLLKQVAAEDKKPDAKKVVESQFDRIVLVRMGQRDRKELAELLGVDPLAAATGPLGTDLHKPVSDQTESKIAAALAGQGGAPSRPDGTKPAAKAPEHAALVVPFAPLHPASNSAEMKRFFDNRRPARAGTVQIFLVIRETGS